MIRGINFPSILVFNLSSHSKLSLKFAILSIFPLQHKVKFSYFSNCEFCVFLIYVLTIKLRILILTVIFNYGKTFSLGVRNHASADSSGNSDKLL